MRAIFLITTVAFALTAPLVGQVLVPAASESFGSGCSPCFCPPILTITPPVMGAPAAISIWSSVAHRPGEIWFSSGGPVNPPYIIGNQCPIFLDVLNASRFVSFSVDDVGVWDLSVQVPIHPALAGTELTFQAILHANFPPGVPWTLDYVTSNGVKVTLGY